MIPHGKRYRDLVDSLTRFKAVVNNEAVQQVRHDSDNPITAEKISYLDWRPVGPPDEAIFSMQTDDPVPEDYGI